eukprot:366055-Chlamydomonas_euryale.AAC.20
MTVSHPGRLRTLLSFDIPRRFLSASLFCLRRCVLPINERCPWGCQRPPTYACAAAAGVTQMSVKLRVMPKCWLVLLRLWMRVDGLMVGAPLRRACMPLLPCMHTPSPCMHATLPCLHAPTPCMHAPRRAYMPLRRACMPLCRACMLIRRACMPLAMHACAFAVHACPSAVHACPPATRACPCGKAVSLIL